MCVMYGKPGATPLRTEVRCAHNRHMCMCMYMCSLDTLLSHIMQACRCRRMHQSWRVPSSPPRPSLLAICSTRAMLRGGSSPARAQLNRSSSRGAWSLRAREQQQNHAEHALRVFCEVCSRPSGGKAEMRERKVARGPKSWNQIANEQHFTCTPS
jgi:hypothetical protein